MMPCSLFQYMATHRGHTVLPVCVATVAAPTCLWVGMWAWLEPGWDQVGRKKNHRKSSHKKFQKVSDKFQISHVIITCQKHCKIQGFLSLSETCLKLI